MNETDVGNKTSDKRHHVRIHIDQKQHESPNPTTGESLYRLGGVQLGLVLYREVTSDREDPPIDNGPEIVHLREDEHLHSGPAKPNEHEVKVIGCLLPGRTDSRTFKVLKTAPLIKIMHLWATATGHTLLPDPETPLDRLHNIIKHDEVGPAIEDLQQPTGEFIEAPHTSHDFGIELVGAFRVNTRWWIAPKESMTPHEILDQAGLNFQEYTLYRDQSATPLPLDTAFPVNRGDVFEAQRNGKYGSLP